MVLAIIRCPLMCHCTTNHNAYIKVHMVCVSQTRAMHDQLSLLRIAPTMLCICLVVVHVGIFIFLNTTSPVMEGENLHKCSKFKARAPVDGTKATKYHSSL